MQASQSKSGPAGDQGLLFAVDDPSFLSTSKAHAIWPLSFPLFRRGGKLSPEAENFPNIPKMRTKPVKMSPANGANVATVFRGFELLGLDPLAQSVYVSAVMNATKRNGDLRYPTVVVQIPRRAAKTTSVWAELIGRCDTQENYVVATTAQDGIRARARFMDQIRLLRRTDFEGKQNPNRRRGSIITGKGNESIEWDNGSRIEVIPPDESSFRGGGYDAVFLDEAGEFSVEQLDELQSGILPTFDTRPGGGQLILAGTPARRRVGWFWEEIQNGLNNVPGTGIVSYHLRDSQQLVTYSDDDEPILNKRLLRRIHPGIGSLTTMAKIVERFNKMSLDKFLREYACLWPTDAVTSALNLTAWNSAIIKPADRPETIGIAFDIEPDGTAGSLVAAWRDSENKAVFEVLACRPGTEWIMREGLKAAKKYRVPIAYDAIGANADVANRLQRSRAQVSPMYLKSMYGAAARIADEIDRRNIAHFDQPDLNRAVEGATWRNVGEGGRLFSRKNDANPVHPLVAASVALWTYDDMSRQGARAGILRS